MYGLKPERVRFSINPGLKAGVNGIESVTGFSPTYCCKDTKVSLRIQAVFVLPSDFVP